MREHLKEILIFELFKRKMKHFLARLFQHFRQLFLQCGAG